MLLHHLLRSRIKSFLTLAVALVFMLASGWILQTMERSRLEVDKLYDTTVVEADIVLADPSTDPTDRITHLGNRPDIPEYNRQRNEQRLRGKQCSRGRYCLVQN